ncbi:MAG: YccF domain-containing protein [Vagococcus sp.]
MGCIGNIIWLLLGGLAGAVSWFLAGILWCITIIGIPIGLQCFKMAGLSLWPFGKKVVYSNSGTSLLLNIIWLIVSGIPLAIAHFTSGLLLCVTIIGIPFGMQSFKLAQLALMPFGARVVPSGTMYMDIE